MDIKPNSVTNKDIPILSNYLYIRKAIERLEEQIAWEHDRKINISQHITGMPNGKGGVNGLDNTFARIDALEQEHRERVEHYRSYARRIDRILTGIESLSMRVFVRMKYMEKRQNVEIRKELNLSRRGFDRAISSIEGASSMDQVKWAEKYIFIEENENNL